MEIKHDQEATISSSTHNLVHHLQGGQPLKVSIDPIVHAVGLCIIQSQVQIKRHLKPGRIKKRSEVLK